MPPEVGFYGVAPFGANLATDPYWGGHVDVGYESPNTNPDHINTVGAPSILLNPIGTQQKSDIFTIVQNNSQQPGSYGSEHLVSFYIKGTMASGDILSVNVGEWKNNVYSFQIFNPQKWTRWTFEVPSMIGNTQVLTIEYKRGNSASLGGLKIDAVKWVSAASIIPSNPAAPNFKIEMLQNGNISLSWSTADFPVTRFYLAEIDLRTNLYSYVNGAMSVIGTTATVIIPNTGAGTPKRFFRIKRF